MAKPGPKPKAGDRYASGRLKPNCASGPAPTAIKRAVEAALRGAGDPRWGSTIGRLRLEGVIVDRQLGAAESYGKLRQAQPRHGPSPGGPPPASSTRLAGATPRRASWTTTNSTVSGDHSRLLAEVGPLRTVLDRVVLFDEAPLPGELPRLKAGLDLLVMWFRIGEV